jgi:hypothetical protein
MSIRLAHLRHRFKAQTALDDVSLRRCASRSACCARTYIAHVSPKGEDWLLHRPAKEEQ